MSLASASETVWVFGNVATPPDEADYSGVLYYEFNFTVQSSNATWITVYPLTVTVVAPLLVMVDVALAQDEQLNMTGQFNNDNTAEIPLDYFVAEEVNRESDSTHSDWIQTLKDFWGMVGVAGKTLVVLIVQMVAAFAGVTVPEWVVSLAVVAFVASLFLKLGRKLPLIIAVLMFFIVVAVISNLIVSLMT